MKKICKTCKLEKENFNKTFTVLKTGEKKVCFGLNCRDCLRISRPHWFKRQRYANTKKARAVELFGGKCLKCGIVDSAISIYDFHHLDKSKKEGNIRFGNSWENVLKQIEGCILLCSNCHRKEHFEN